MSDESHVPTGQVSITPEGGPADEGVPPSAPGAGQVRLTPEAGPLDDAETLAPPTWQEHMSGPIPGLDDAPAHDGGKAEERQETTRTTRDDDELSKWPPYSGKPVSDVSEAMRYAAPVVAMAEKLAIKALDLSGRGLTGLARFLDERRQNRTDEGSGDRPGTG